MKQVEQDPPGSEGVDLGQHEHTRGLDKGRTHQRLRQPPGHMGSEIEIVPWAPRLTVTGPDPCGIPDRGAFCGRSW